MRFSIYRESVQSKEITNKSVAQVVIWHSKFRREMTIIALKICC